MTTTDAPQKFIDDLTDSANGAKEVIDSYGDMWDTYILQDRIFANGELADSWHEVNEAYSDYQKAFVSGDEESITKAKEAFAEIMLHATEGLDDQSVIDYFENMYPELQSVVGGWKFRTSFDANTDDLQTKVQSALDELKDDDGRALTAEEILGLDAENKQYQALISIAHSYNMTLEEMIELLKERNMVSAMDYQGLVRLFGQDNVDKLTPEDLEIAYTIKNVGNMTFEQLQAEIQKTKEVTREPVSLSISDTIDQLNTQLKPAFDSLKSAYQDIFTDDGYNPNAVDIPMLDSIKSSIEEINKLEGVDIDIDMGAFDTLATTLADAGTTEGQARQAFSDFATSIFYASNATDGMTEETRELVEQLLESLGVINATEVAEYALAEAKAKEMLATYDVINAKDGEYAAILAEGAAAGITRQQLYSLMAAEIAFGNNDLSVEGKISKLKELATQYGDTASAALATAIANDLASGHTDVDSAVNDLMAQINAGVQRIDINFGNVGGGSKSAGKAGKEAADKYLEAFEKELKDLDDLKDRGKITEKQYLDALRRLYLKYFRDKEKYLKEYEKHEHQYLDGMKSLYESAFSYITKQIDKRIDAINGEKDAAISALEAERDARLEGIEAEKKRHEEQIEFKEKEIEAREKEIKAMQDANEERRRSLDLQKAEYEFQRMQNQRTDFVYKDGQMSYQADTSGIRDAKQEIEDAKLEIDISKIQTKIDLLEGEKGLLQDKIDLLDKEAEKVNEYYDDAIAKTEQRYDAMIKGMEAYKSQFEGLAGLLENAQMEAALSELGVNMDALLSGSREEFEKLKAAYVGILADMGRGNDEVIGQLSRLAGVNAESVSHLESTKGAFENLGAATLEGLGSSVDGVGKSTAGLAASAGEASAAMGGVQGSVDGTSKSITPLNAELEKLNGLIADLTALLNGIEFPEPGDEGYAEKLNGIALAFGGIAAKCAELKNMDFTSIIGTGSATTAGKGDPLSDGNASDTQGQAGTGFMGLASAVSEAVTAVSGQMDSLQIALQVGNDAFDGQISKIRKEYLPAWVELQARLAEIIGVGGGAGENKGEGNQKSGGKDGGSESGENGNGIIGILQTGGDEVAAKLEDPWLKAFNDFATDGGSSVQSICDKIIEMVKGMADTIQEQCAAAANALNALAETIGASGMPSVGVTVSGNTVPAHTEGTVGKGFAKGTGGYKGLPHDERDALRSEYGQPELTVYPDGKAELTTEPTMGDLPKGTVIFNEEQTERIMENKGKALKTYENGNVKLVDGTIITKDGRTLRPLTPNDRKYQMIKKFEEYFNANRDAFMKPAYAMNNAATAMEKAVEVINNNSTMNRNMNVDVGGIHVHGVQNPEDFSDIVSMRAHNRILQEMKKY